MRTLISHCHPVLLAGLALAGAPAHAERNEPLTILITAPRLAEDPLQASAAYTRVDETDLQQARQGLQLDESLSRVPGVLFRNRYNFAQNLRLSIRGFGARAPFGVRGIRLLVDGFPETLPDGQSQVDGIDLESVSRVAVIRGPASALYGNAAGGVLQVETLEPPEVPYGELRASAGSEGFWRLGVRAGGVRDDWGTQLSAWRLGYEGYRQQSRTRKDMLNAKLRHDLDERRSLTAVLTALDQPLGQDPGGLTLAEVRADRRQAAPNALALDAGQAVRQQRLGLTYRDAASLPGELSARLFLTRRDFSQQLPFPGPSLIGFERDFYGAGLDYRGDTRLGQRALRYTLGLESARQRDDRERYRVDAQGNQTGQIQDAVETATETGLYGQAELALGARTDLTLGARYDRVHFRIDDRFTADATASGRRDYDEMSYSLGLGFQAQPAHRFYASIGSSFETPSFTEFYDPTRPEQGFDPTLDPQQALNLELGAKGVYGASARYELALFQVRTRDEIVQVATDPDRFANAARTRRDGLEAGLEYQLPDHWSLSGAYTWGRYRFREFVDASGADLRGKALPGLPAHSLFAELAWRGPNGAYAVLDGLAHSRVHADNANQVEVPGYAVFNLRAGVRRSSGTMDIETFVGVNNLADRKYFSNLRINAAGGRYYEPAPERNFHAGVRVRF